MGRLRDFFASAGFCESTHDLSRKPDLVRQITTYSLASASPKSLPDATYESRLQRASHEADSASLDQLIANQVIVCLDQRLPNLKTSPLDNVVYYAFYNTGGQKILSLYDNPKRPEDVGFFETSVADYSGPAVNGLAKDILGQKNIPPALLGNTYYDVATKGYRIKWVEASDGEIQKNPSLKEPPAGIRPLLPQPTTPRPSTLG